MPVDFDSNADGDPTRVDSDTPMFAPIPTWERGKKRRGFGGGRPAAAEPRTFADTDAREVEATSAGAATAGMAATPAMGSEPLATDRLDRVEPTDTGFMAGAPLAGDRRAAARRSSSMAPMAIAGGLVLLAGVAGAGWYYSQPHDQGMAQLTPGGATPPAASPLTPPADQVAQAPAAAPAPPPVSRSSASASAAAAPVRTARAAPAPRPARARSVDRSAADEGVNAAAVARTPAPAPSPVQV
ncbi:MAG TPA: hypothetical protein VGC92_07855, partial [Phenylobacterium sp.]